MLSHERTIDEGADVGEQKLISLQQSASFVRRMMLNLLGESFPVALQLRSCVFERLVVL